MKPLSIHFDDSAGAAIRGVILSNSGIFFETSPSSADVIIFGTDELPYLRQNLLWNSYRQKCICISETDIPTFRMPGLYAANERSYVTRSRTTTINYFISDNDNPNPEIARLSGQRFDKLYLYSFMGGTNSWARRRLFRSVGSTGDTLVEATDAYNHWTDDFTGERRSAQRRRYAEIMAASKYALCPRGCGLSSYRLFEAMSLGVAPVIISDKWKRTDGVDWSFAIFLPERHIPNVDRIVRSHENEWEERGQAALSAYCSVFAKGVVSETLYRQISHVLATYSPVTESLMNVAIPLLVAKRAATWALYRSLKFVVLQAFQLSGVAFPFRLYGQLDRRPLNRQIPS